MILRGLRGQVECIAVSSDGHSLAAGGQDGIVYLWDVADARLAGKVCGS